MKKKIILSFVAVCMIVSFGVSIHAATSGTCGDNLTWILDNNGCLKIWGSGSMTDWTDGRATPWSNYGMNNSKITSVWISDGVTSIGNSAFEDCKNLKTVTIPNDLKSIGNYAFIRCESLEAVTLPEGLEVIGNSAFFGCHTLTDVEIGPDVKTIGDTAFAYCKSLTGVSVSSDNKYYSSLNGNLFNKDKTRLIQYIEDDSKYTVPKTVTTIGELAFYNYDDNLTSVTIPVSVTTIEHRAFYKSGKIETVYYGGTKAEWESISIGMYNTSLTEATLYCTTDAGTCGENLTWSFYDNKTLIIDGVGAMYDWSDGRGTPWGAYYSDITNVIIGDDVTSIGNSAFETYKKLESVKIGNNVTSIGRYAFNYCTLLTDLTLPDSLNTIGRAAFNCCNALAAVEIPDGVTSIGEDAFANSQNIKSVTIPSSVTNIDIGAFSGCESLEGITVDENNNNYSSLDGSLFDKNITTLIQYAGDESAYVVPDTVTTICESAFETCSSGNPQNCLCSKLESVTIPVSVTSIGSGAFNTSYNITDVYFDGTKEEWENIDIGTYNNCLTNATIHFKQSSVNVTIGTDVVEYSSLEKAVEAVNNNGTAATISLTGAVEAADVTFEYNHTLALNGFTITELNLTGDAILKNGTVTTLNVTGLVETENVTVTNTDAVMYGTEGTNGVYTSLEAGVCVIDGAQVRVGKGVDENGLFTDGSGIRFIGQADLNDTLTSLIMAERYSDDSFDEGYAVGLEIRAEDSDKVIYVPAEKWQDEENGVFTAAITNLAHSNFNRNYTAQVYIEYNGIKMFTGSSVTRSIYAVASGLLAQSSEEDADRLINVLNAYVNQTGIRLVFKDSTLTVNDGVLGIKGAYTGNAFFTVGDTLKIGNTYYVGLTPVGANTKLDVEHFAKYIRINNNNSQISTAVSLVDNNDGTYTLTFNLNNITG